MTVGIYTVSHSHAIPYVYLTEQGQYSKAVGRQGRAQTVVGPTSINTESHILHQGNECITFVRRFTGLAATLVGMANTPFLRVKTKYQDQDSTPDTFTKQQKARYHRSRKHHQTSSNTKPFITPIIHHASSLMNIITFPKKNSIDTCCVPGTCHNTRYKRTLYVKGCDKRRDNSKDSLLNPSTTEEEKKCVPH